MEKYKVVKPNFEASILSVIESIKKFYHEESNLPYDLEVLEALNRKNPDNIVLLLLDGLGSACLNRNLDDNDILKKNKIKDLIAIYPSTTSAATVSTLSGKAPIETGWTGWENYIKELNRNVILFTGINYFTKEPTGVDIRQSYLPYTYFFEDFKVYNDVVFPAFGKNPSKTFKELLDNCIKLEKKNKKSFLYAYWDNPDSTLHEYGDGTKEVKDIITDINKTLEEKLEFFPNNTTIIVVADHGHVNVSHIDLFLNKELYDMLERNPSNDARCITFKVKNEYYNEFPTYFNSKYNDIYTLYKKEDFIKNGFLGNSNNINPKIDDFLGDYIGVAISDKYFRYNPISEIFKSHHAGMTEDEMLIPLIIIEK